MLVPKRPGTLALLATLTVAVFACKRGGEATPSPSAAAATDDRSAGEVLTVCTEYQASWIRNFNPLIAPMSSRWITFGIHEPMLIHNAITGEYVPWLATEYAWSDGNTTLTFKTRSNVSWSDGVPFTANDVAFTFDLIRRFKALDIYNVWESLADVKATDDGTVVFKFKKPNVPLLFYIGHMQAIVPEHTWKGVADPVKYPNEHPVGTGPFTEIKVFQNQIYEVGRNPHYWQPGKPAVKAIRFPAYPSNDQSNLALINGEIDWAATFIPDIDKVFVAKDPAHHHYWYPLISNTIFLYANTTRKPFDDVRVRKALSMALNREQIVRIASYNYTRPADATGLSDAYTKWRNPAAIEVGTWTKYDPDAANRLLDEAGLKKGPNGIRLWGDKPLRYDINVVTGWSDWVRAVQLMSQDLKKVGIDANLKAYDYAAYFEKEQKGDYDLTIGWSPTGPTPYNLYRGLMGTSRWKPIGEPALENWERFSSSDADALLAAFEMTTDPDEQKRIMDKIQMIFVELAPVIPLFPNVTWGVFNDKRFTGFPDKDHPYARLPPYPPPDYLLVLTALKPR